MRSPSNLHFQRESKKGYTYQVRSDILYHNAGFAGMVQGPFYEKREMWVDKEGKVHWRDYLVTPVHAFKEDIFDIWEGELGDLLDIEKNQGRITYMKVRWKDAIEVYYSNPTLISVASKSKTRLPIEARITLEELFTVIKKEPKKQK